MEIIKHQSADRQIAEIKSENMLINTPEDGLQILGDLYYQGYEGVILYEKNITSAFFDLKTGIAGEILQKFTTYRMQLAIVGDFGKYESRSLQDFIYESNKGRQVNFAATPDQAIAFLLPT